MKVKLLVSIAGTSHIHGKGSVVDMEPAEAKRYIDAGLAEPFAEAMPAIEKAIPNDIDVETNLSPVSSKHKKQRPS